MKEGFRFSSGAVPRGGARSGDCVCRGGYTNIWDGSIASAFAGGTGTAENPYQIATGAQLAYLASSVNNGETYAGKNFVLTADIDLNKRPWTPIANAFSDALFGGSDYRIFAGNLDGQVWIYRLQCGPSGQRKSRWNQTYSGFSSVTEGKINPAFEYRFHPRHSKECFRLRDISLAYGALSVLRAEASKTVM